MTGDRGGLLIAFEGLDGGGKSTQCALLAEALREAGQRCTVMRLSSGDPVEEMLGDLAVDTPVEVVGNRFAVIAKLLCRQEWVVEPRLRRGEAVIYDKYLLSFLAKETVRGANPAQLRTMVQRLRPADLTIVLDVEPDEALRRKQGRVTYREAGLNLNTYNGEPVSPDAFRRGAYPHAWVRERYLEFQGGARQAQARLLDAAETYWNGGFGRRVLRLPAGDDRHRLAEAIAAAAGLAVGSGKDGSLVAPLGQN